MSGNGRAFTVPPPIVGTFSSIAEQNKRPTTWTSSLPSHKASPDHFSQFRFPESTASTSDDTAFSAKHSTSGLRDPLRQDLSPQSHDQNTHLEQHMFMTRVLSPGSVHGTPRGSGEFYSTSNNSTETLASEWSGHETPQIWHRPVHSRQVSSLAPVRRPRHETLMMGYAQITGSFAVDASLVNQNSFEEVKRKGIVGGQGGGGLVRTQSSKRNSGILGSLGWTNLGETFGGLLGNGGMSSMNEAKKMSDTKFIPIVSAPQSILFVDLRLAPGESKTYRFSHPLPRGIPPSHRGKAIKVTYSLVIGTQRAVSIAQQGQVKRVEIPFKVLPCVNSKASGFPCLDQTNYIGEGEILGHDIMSPHTLLSNSAVVVNADGYSGISKATSPISAPSKPYTSINDFNSYVKKLLDNPQFSLNSGLLSPTEDESRSHAQVTAQSSSAKELIDFAILRSNTVNSAKQSANRFVITRSGDRVAVIMLARPAYRVGETIQVAVEFLETDVSCYSLHAMLETSETVDPALALRSKATIQRVTRRIYSSHFEYTISAERVLFNPMIPSNATPEFITTGVNLEWKLRFEFVTSTLGGTESIDRSFNNSMEEVTRDDRGSVEIAVQGLPCEVFDVIVPLRVYGGVAAFDENTDSGDFQI